MTRQIACAAVVDVVGSLAAATVMIDPGNGVETNVTAHGGRGGRSRVRHRQVRRHVVALQVKERP